MIPRYTDHAANERTFLAWIRTALAIMAFGLVIERFDVFLHSINMAKGGPMLSASLLSARWVGLILVVVGTLTIIIASWRFVRDRNAIESEEQRPFHGRGTLLLAALMIMLALLLTLYLLSQW